MYSLCSHTGAESFIHNMLQSKNIQVVHLISRYIVCSCNSRQEREKNTFGLLVSNIWFHVWRHHYNVFNELCSLYKSLSFKSDYMDGLGKQ